MRAVRPEQIVQIHAALLSDIGLYSAGALLGEQKHTTIPLTVIPLAID